MQQPERPINGTPGAERRKDKRFRVRNGSFAALCPRFSVLGQITNVSSGGLAFRYVASEERSRESSQLSILLTDGSFCLDKIPFETIWDSPVPGEFSFGPITLRQCGVQFEALTHSQRLDLKYFMGHYSMGKGDVANSDDALDQTRGR